MAKRKLPPLPFLQVNVTDDLAGFTAVASGKTAHDPVSARSAVVSLAAELGEKFRRVLCVDPGIKSPDAPSVWLVERDLVGVAQ